MSNELKSTINLKIGGSESTESSDMSDDLDDITINPINNSDSEETPEETPEKTYENTLQDKLDNVDINELRKLLNKSNIKRIQQQVVDQVGEYKDNDKLPKVSIEAVQEIDEQIAQEIKDGILPDPSQVDPITGEPIAGGDLGDVPVEDDLEGQAAVTDAELANDTKKAEI